MKKVFFSALVMLLMGSAAVYADGNKPAKHKAKTQTTCSAKDCKPTADCKPGTKCPTKPGCVCH